MEAAARTQLWSFDLCRSSLPAASIVHTHPPSQPCPVSFLFSEATPMQVFARVFKIAIGWRFDRSLWPGGKVLELTCCSGSRDILI